MQMGRTRGTETSKYPQEKKTKCDSASSGERTRNSPNRRRFGGAGVVGPRRGKTAGQRKALENAAKDGESPVRAILPKPSGILSNAEHEEFCAKLRGPSRKAKYSRETDSEPVP